MTAHNPGQSETYFWNKEKLDFPENDDKSALILLLLQFLDDTNGN